MARCGCVEGQVGVVAAGAPRAIAANHTHLATTPEEWLSAIDRAVTEADDEELAKQRIAFAETHSWGHSVKKIYDIIDNFLKEKAT